MSLICAHCGHIIVMSNSPDHLGGCPDCPINEEEGKRIREASRIFHKKVNEND